MNVKRIIATNLFLLVLLAPLSAQQSYIDSLKNELETCRNDTFRLVLYSNLCSAYQNKSYDSTLSYSEKQFALAKQMDYRLDEAYALDNIGYNMYYLSNPKALQMLLEGLEIAENPGIEENVVPKKYWNKIIYYDLNALPKSQKTPRNVRMQILASLNQDVGHVYGNDFGNREKQLFYYYKAANIAKGVDDKYSLILNYNTIANTYRLINKMDSALLYGQKALDLALNYGFEPLSVHALSIIGSVYYEEKNYPLSKTYSRRAVEGSAKYNIITGVVQADLTLSNVFFLEHAFDSSFFYAKKAYETAERINSPQSILSSSDALVKLYASKNKLDSAFKYLQLSYALKDNVYSSEKIKQIQRLDFEEQEKQKEIEASKQKYKSQLRIYLLFGGLVALLVIAGVLLRSNRHKQKAFALLQRQKQETDKQRVKAEQALTELKSTQAQLVQSEKMASLGELTAGIAHEIQNPLNFVNNFSEVNEELLGELVDEADKGHTADVKTIAENIKQNLEKINHHGKRADAIVKGMLQHSRTSTGQKELTDINALCDEYLRLAYHGLRAKEKSFNAEIKTEFDHSIGKINIVPQDIGRVLLNLINNAFYAVNEKKQQLDGSYEPTVSIKTTRLSSPLGEGGNKVEIKVKDNGNGIPQKIADKIFQPFFTTKPTGQGTGLGLSLAYDIVKAHGGEIKVETKEGEGSEFIIELPG
jgi:signal transduction histidine kinase